jgi:hypothetical protein
MLLLASARGGSERPPSSARHCHEVVRKEVPLSMNGNKVPNNFLFYSLEYDEFV